MNEEFARTGAAGEQKNLYPEYPVLLIDDEKNILRSYELALRSAGINNIIACDSGIRGRDIVRNRKVELIILDMMMPEIQGDKLLDEFKVEYPDIPVIMVTCVNSLDQAVECVRRGASEYLVKPVNLDKLLDKIRKYMNIRRMRRESERARQSMLEPGDESFSASFNPIVTKSEYMYEIFNYCSTIAPNRQPVLITGETGVGKELFARALHAESGCRGKLVTVNIAGLDDNMISDTLFGHKKGAFTGAVTDRPGVIENARNGTLFIDEIGDLNISSQIKLLRLLQEREYQQLGSDEVKISSARVLLATHRDLLELQNDSKFRDDLYYRISTHHIEIPPLRERKDDIPLLLEHFIAKAAKAVKKKKPAYPDELITLLQSYHFPGNIRELESMAFDAVSRHKSRTLSSRVFNAHMKRNSRRHSAVNKGCESLEACLASLEILPQLKELDKALVKEALRRSNGNQSVAAGLLGVTPQALSARLKRMNK